MTEPSDLESNDRIPIEVASGTKGPVTDAMERTIEALDMMERVYKIHKSYECGEAIRLLKAAPEAALSLSLSAAPECRAREYHRTDIERLLPLLDAFRQRPEDYTKHAHADLHKKAFRLLSDLLSASPPRSPELTPSQPKPQFPQPEGGVPPQQAD